MLSYLNLITMNFYCNYHDIIEYENKIRKLKNKEILNEEEIKEINITNFINRLFLEVYVLIYKDFKYENENNLNTNKSRLRKTLVKKIPNLVIKENIRYI